MPSGPPSRPPLSAPAKRGTSPIVAIFYPFSQCCEIEISPLSLQKQPKASPNLFERGVEYGKYDYPETNQQAQIKTLIQNPNIHNPNKPLYSKP